MGTSCYKGTTVISERNNETENQIKIFRFTRMSNNLFDIIQKKINEMTGFNNYASINIKLNNTQKEIKGTYFQYNKGCIMYALINNGWIDEQYIPDSMKFYKNHNHKEDERNNRDFLRKCISVIDLAQLWVNIGGDCPYLEIDLTQVKKRIYLILKDYFDEEKEKEKTEIMKKVGEMTWQNKDYFELLGKLKNNIQFIPLMEIEKIKNNPCIKKAIDENIIKKRDIIKFGRHCFIYDGIVEVNSEKFYSFQDSLSYFHLNQKKPNPNYNNSECDKRKGFVYARENTQLINKNNTKDFDIGIVSVKI